MRLPRRKTSHQEDSSSPPLYRAPGKRAWTHEFHQQNTAAIGACQEKWSASAEEPRVNAHLQVPPACGGRGGNRNPCSSTADAAKPLPWGRTRAGARCRAERPPATFGPSNGERGRQCAGLSRWMRRSTAGPLRSPWAPHAARGTTDRIHLLPGRTAHHPPLTTAQPSARLPTTFRNAKKRTWQGNPRRAET